MSCLPAEPMNRSHLRHAREIQFTWASLALTATATALLLGGTGSLLLGAIQEGRVAQAFEAALFGALSGFLVYGNLCYQVARLGQLQRTATHRDSRREPTAAFYADSAPALTVLVPSYREELPVIRQTLLSAALQDYPNKRVVLLLDDPPAPRSRQDQATLWASRSLPFNLQAILAEPARHIANTRAAFLERRDIGSLRWDEECVRLSDCFSWVAEWYEGQAKQTPADSHTDVWFVEHILTQPGLFCREQSTQWFARRKQVSSLSAETLRQDIASAYAGLAARFDVVFDVFERKQYRNLSHEPNKAMNLNSYLGLMGKRVKPVLRKDGLHLEETSSQLGSRLIPDTPYVITLDADSLLKDMYASTLVRLMERPEHARIAVAQTPYSAFPNAPGALERTAGATTDIQYLVHQGFTRFDATFWVGANALLRKSALEEIRTVEQEGDKLVSRYIQDRTVIEDTESTVDLLGKGWTLYNYPERLAYSATPPDFGSLVIQRARWANGGLIIFPKLLFSLRHRSASPRALVQALLQTHYLTSLAFAPLSVLLLLAMPFSAELMTVWMPLAALPYFALYARDLQMTGYRPMRDLLRIYALNLLLIPVHLTGAITSIRQAVAGIKIPFRRTPKIAGRTRTAGLDLTLQLGIVGLSLSLGLYYVSHQRWISGAFALANAGLLLYGIRHFIGFSELAQDLLHSANGSVPKPAWDSCANTFFSGARLVTDTLRQTAMQTGRLLSAPRQAIWGLLLLLEVLSPSLAIGADVPKNVMQRENERPGTTAWLLTTPAVRGEIEGYASAPSVNQGETIQLYVNTAAPTYRLTVYRMGWYGGLGAREMRAAVRYQGRRQTPPHRETATGLVECRWTDPITLTIPVETAQEPGWPSGYYLAKLTAEPRGEESYVLFVVREDNRASALLVQSSVTTFHAYNNWGGKSLYDYNSSGGRALAVSLNRPYAASPDPVAADSTGAGPFLRGWEYDMVRWLERSGYDVAYTTNLDLDRHPDALRPHRAILTAGHDEYWTWSMRRALEAARDRGTHLAFFSANSGYWQVRLEPGRTDHQPRRTIVAYKERAATHDPVLLDHDEANDHLATTTWRSAPVNRPEAALLGGMYLEGSPEVDGDLVLAETDHWMVQGMGLQRGMHLPGLLGYEVDGLADASPANVTVITSSPVGPRFAASTLYQAASGAWVFNAGSMQWVWGLDDFRADPSRQPRVNQTIQQITRRLLDRMSRGPEPLLAQGADRP